jgi:hypothetical protein
MTIEFNPNKDHNPWYLSCMTGKDTLLGIASGEFDDGWTCPVAALARYKYKNPFILRDLKNSSTQVLDNIPMWVIRKDLFRSILGLLEEEGPRGLGFTPADSIVWFDTDAGEVITIAIEGFE